MNTNNPKIWVITGPIQVGKTHFCSHLVQQAHILGLSLAGVICPPIYDAQQKTSIIIEDLKTHERRVLAKVRTTESDGLFTDHWLFDEEALTWGNQIFANTKGCDLLLVDELGPLEFTRGQGWQNGLIAIDQGFYERAVVVVRPSLVATALERWPQAAVIEIPSGLEVEEMNRLIQNILA